MTEPIKLCPFCITNVEPKKYRVYVEGYVDITAYSAKEAITTAMSARITNVDRVSASEVSE